MHTQNTHSSVVCVSVISLSRTETAEPQVSQFRGAGTKQTLIGSRNHVLDGVKLPIVNGTSERLLENIVKDFWESSRRLALQNRCTYQRAIFLGGDRLVWAQEAMF